MRLIVDPEAGLVDGAVAWTIEGADGGSQVDLRLSGADAAGQRWSSANTYQVGKDGVLEVADPDEPWASMRPADAGAAPVAFTAPDSEWIVDAEATVGGDVARASLRRLYRRDLEVRHRDGDGWHLLAFSPHGQSAPSPGVLVVPGTTGVQAMAPIAALLASHGYPAAVLGYMDGPGLPPTFDRIPIEVVSNGLTAFEEADPKRTALWAASVGTGLALSALTVPEATAVAAVIAVAPTDVVWQAMSTAGRPPERSALTSGGIDLPWLALRGQAILGQLLANALRRRLPGRPGPMPLRLHDAYARARTDTASVERATIPVEHITAPMLLLAGTADAMWPAQEMARRIGERRRAAGVGSEDELVVLADAGHFSRPPATPTTVDHNADLVSGGTQAGNAIGQRHAWDTALAFLRRTLA